MDDLPRQKLKLIIAKYGLVIHDDPQRCEAFLRDFCGQYRQEISLLINAQKEKVPSELLNSQNNSLPVSLTISRLSKRLEDNLAIKPEAAKWSVESWALALNLITEAEPLIDEGRSEEAKDEYQPAIRLNPQNAIAHHTLGDALYAQGKLEEAKAEYQQAIRLDPNYTYAHNNLGSVLYAQGKLEEAKAEYQRAIQLNPKNAIAHVGLRRILETQGKLNEYPQVENIDIARTTFDKVWYLPEENLWRDMNMLAMRDIGTLVVKNNSLEFQGKKEHVHITNVKRISYGKQGRDFVNNWVKINYGDGKTAFFADGSQLGWGGMFGGTRRILDAVRHLEQSS